MARTIARDELHRTVRAPAGLPKARYRGMRRGLHGDRLPRRKRRAVADGFRHYHSLRPARIRLGR